MAIIPFPDWTPDQMELASSAISIRNALPGLNSYVPMPSYAALTGAMDARCRGAIDVRDKDLNVYQYAGDAAKLYRLSTTTWTDSSKALGYSTDTEEIWEFARWKNQVLATNWDDDIQFLELGGTTFADLTTDFKCRRLFVIRDHVVAANTWDSTDGNVPDRVRTSSFDDETAWTPDPATGSIARDIKSGPILKCFGGDYGILFTENDTYRMDWVGAPTWFEINPTLEGVGVLSPGACARIGDDIFAWTNQGFLKIRHGTSYEPIGAGRVDEYLSADLDEEYRYRMSAVADPRAGRIFWAYPGAGNDQGQPNRIACYDKNFNKWSIIDQDVDLLWQAGGIGTTLDGLDSFSSSIDDLLVSLDSSQWKGGGVQLFGAFDTSFQHGFFDGSPMAATIETKEVEFIEGMQSTVTAHRPVVDGGSYTSEIGYRNQLGNERQYTTGRAPTGTGRVTLRKDARYHTFRLTISGEWTHAAGVQVTKDDVKAAGRRARSD